jgi:NTP pyrophosphatase (non-canonical NTP hydrolase)
MTAPNFIKNAMRTCSPNFYGERVARHEFNEAFNNAIDAANQLDKVKKSLFYGRDNNLDPRDGQKDVCDLPARINENDPAMAIDLLHGIIGKFTEAGELLEALKRVFNGFQLDTVNIEEEIGDGFWYDAIILNRTGGSFDEIQARIIEKLRTRFPDAYSDYNANERDLDKERVVLEGAQPFDVDEAKRKSDLAFEAVEATKANMIDAPVTSGTKNSELAKSPAARMAALPGEHLAHQHIRKEDADR